METGGFNGLLTSNVQDFYEVKGIKKAKAAQLLALAEISKRFRSYKSGRGSIQLAHLQQWQIL